MYFALLCQADFVFGFSLSVQMVLRGVEKNKFFEFELSHSIFPLEQVKEDTKKFSALWLVQNYSNLNGHFRPQKTPKYKGSSQNFKPDFVLAITFDPMNIFQFRWKPILTIFVANIDQAITAILGNFGHFQQFGHNGLT